MDFVAEMRGLSDDLQSDKATRRKVTHGNLWAFLLTLYPYFVEGLELIGRDGSDLAKKRIQLPSPRIVVERNKISC